MALVHVAPALAAGGSTTPAAKAPGPKAPTTCQQAAQLQAARRSGRAAERSARVRACRSLRDLKLLAQHLEDPCQGGEALLSDGELAAAKTEFEAALVEDASRSCATEGLKKLQEKSNEDRRISWATSARRCSTFCLIAWPWLAGIILLRFIVTIVRSTVWKPHSISVSAPGDQKEFAASVIEAADAAGEGTRRPLKVITAADAALPTETIANLSKLIGIPSSIPLQAALDLVIGSVAYRPG